MSPFSYAVDNLTNKTNYMLDKFHSRTIFFNLTILLFSGVIYTELNG